MNGSRFKDYEAQFSQKLIPTLPAVDRAILTAKANQ